MMTQPQNQAFREALQHWLSIHCPDKARAARWLQISRRDLDQYLAGCLPANDCMASILERISGKEGK